MTNARDNDIILLKEYGGDEMRKVEKKVNDNFVEVVGIQSLAKGDEFRMFESDGEPVLTHDGKSLFKSIGEPYYSDKYIMWIIDIETTPLH